MARTVSARIAQEMEGLATAFNNFKGKYISSVKISGNAAAFLTELTQITTAIKDRITKEKINPYPLIPD